MPISYSAGSAPTVFSAARCGSISRRRGARRLSGGGTPPPPLRPPERVAKPLDLDPTAAADGILRIAVTKMSHVVRWVTTERGLDAADFALVAYGGAGPLHAAMVPRGPP